MLKQVLCLNVLREMVLGKKALQIICGGLLLALGAASPLWAQTGVYTQNGGTASQSGKTYSASNTDVSSVYVLNSGVLTLSNCIMAKTGDSSSVNNSSQYGINAGVLAATYGKVTISGGLVTTNASGANGLFATGTAAIIMTNGTITAIGGGAHGVDVTYGGSITLANVNVTTNGDNSSVLATDFGGGTVTASNGIFNSADTVAGSHSAGIYSTGTITVSNSTVISAADCGGVIDGANKIFVTNTYLTSKVEGFKLWKTAPASGTANVTMNGGSLTVSAGDAFYITGEAGNAALGTITTKGGAVITTSTGNIMNVVSSSSAYFYANGETFTGNLVADTSSYLTAALDSTTLTGRINRTALTINSPSVCNVADKSTTFSITNNGTLSFVSSGITLVNSGAYTQSAAGKLLVRLGGVSKYDQVAVTGAATLAGTLQVDFDNSFTPTVGQTFTILTRGSGSGTFSATTSTSGLGYSVAYNTNGIVITITSVSADVKEWANY